MREDYKNLYGNQKVTTEGDVEGKTITHLGTHLGFVDEIALHLADKCYYSLRFKKIKEIKKYIPSRERVNVSFDIDSETWDDNNRKETMVDVFKDRPVIISKCNHYASFTIELKDTDKYLRERALNKLTDKEKQLLGLDTNNLTFQNLRDWCVI